MEPITLFIVTLVLGSVAGVSLYSFREAKERSASRTTGLAAEARSQQVPPSGQR